MWPTNDERSEPEQPPEPAAWLSAYLDGELGAEDHARVEDWLARDPDARAEADALRRVGDWCERCPVPEPGSAAWDRVRAHVSAAVPAPGLLQRTQLPRRGRRPWLWVPAIVAAASVVLAVWIAATLSKRTPPGEAKPTPAASDEMQVASAADVIIDDMDPADAGALVVGRVPPGPYPLPPGERAEVAGSDEVTIVSMEAEDTAALVVGEPPVGWPLALASQGDVQVDHMATSQEHSNKPYLFAPKGGSPMLWPEAVKGDRD